MPAWKVLLICTLICICFGLAMATIAIPIAQEGAQRWIWLSGLSLSTIVVGVVLFYVLRQASEALNIRPRGGRD